MSGLQGPGAAARFLDRRTGCTAIGGDPGGRCRGLLAADGRDENGTLARLKAHRTERLEPILARHGGRLVKLTGDGVLVEFPSAVNALGAAINFQQAMAETNRDQPEESMSDVCPVYLHHRTCPEPAGTSHLGPEAVIARRVRQWPNRLLVSGLAAVPSGNGRRRVLKPRKQGCTATVFHSDAFVSLLLCLDADGTNDVTQCL